MNLAEHEEVKARLRRARSMLDIAYETHSKEGKVVFYEHARTFAMSALDTINKYSLTQGEEE